MCHGCFDLLHLGHVKHFQAAKAMGDILIVTVTADAFVNKGPDRPVFKDTQRTEMIAALECVDYVAINNMPDSAEAILLLKPDIYVKGVDYIGTPKNAEQEAVEKIGAQIAYTKTQKFSSTDFINGIRNANA